MKVFKRSVCKRLVTSAVLGTSLLMGSATTSALNIALTNDDGWDSVGIQAMFNALTNAGHTVTLAAPLDGQSGSGAAVTQGALVIVKQAENVFSVAGASGLEGAEPATSGGVASHISSQLTGGLPDLLISGINDGANVGAATQLSGTVGAVIGSINTLTGAPVPAIAISTDERCDTASAACDEVADFVVNYVDALAVRLTYMAGLSGLLPEGVGLNINYPPGAPLGVKLARQGMLSYVASLGGAVQATTGCLVDCNALAVGDSAEGGIAGFAFLDEDDVNRADNVLFAEGYITVVPITADYTARPKGLKRFLRHVNRIFNHHSHH